MAFPKKNLEKREEKAGRDLDGDREKGESAFHTAKVLGGKPGGGMKQCGKCSKMHLPTHPHFK